MNKKAQSAAVGITIIIGLLIFYFLEIGAITLSAATAVALNTSSFNATGTSFNYFFNSTTGTGYCDDPRYYVKSDGTRGLYIFSSSSTSCNELYAFNQTQCQLVPDCIWQNVTSGILWWQSTNATCTSFINDTYLSLGNTNYTTTTGIYGDGYFRYNGVATSICRSPKGQVGANTCESLGCTWINALNQTTSNTFLASSSFSLFGFINPFSTQPVTIYSVVGFMFGISFSVYNVGAFASLLIVFINWLLGFTLLFAIYLAIRGS